jgi:hypothetical protein
MRPVSRSSLNDAIGNVWCVRRRVSKVQNSNVILQSYIISSIWIYQADMCWWWAEKNAMARTNKHHAYIQFSCWLFWNCFQAGWWGETVFSYVASHKVVTFVRFWKMKWTVLPTDTQTPCVNNTITQPGFCVKAIWFYLQKRVAEKWLRWSRGSVLAFSTQVRRFKPGRSRQIFKGVKILSMPSFGGEVKPSVPCRRFAACKRSLNVPWKLCI